MGNTPKKPKNYFVKLLHNKYVDILKQYDQIKLTNVAQLLSEVTNVHG